MKSGEAGSTSVRSSDVVDRYSSLKEFAKESRQNGPNRKWSWLKVVVEANTNTKDT